MNGARSKVVTVGGREFVVRPLLGKVARDMGGIKRGDSITEMAAGVAIILGRSAPDVTEEWVLENGDVAEYMDVLSALSEVTTGKKATPGEAGGPSIGVTSTP